MRLISTRVLRQAVDVAPRGDAVAGKILTHDRPRSSVEGVDITLLYFEDCPSWEVLHARLRVLAAERPDFRLILQLVETPAEAERTGFHGSPSIQIDGVDVFAEPGLEVGLACRRYLTPDGYQGAPTLDQLRAALPDE